MGHTICQTPIQTEGKAQQWSSFIEILKFRTFVYRNRRHLLHNTTGTRRNYHVDSIRTHTLLQSWLAAFNLNNRFWLYSPQSFALMFQIVRKRRSKRINTAHGACKYVIFACELWTRNSCSHQEADKRSVSKMHLDIQIEHQRKHCWRTSKVLSNKTGLPLKRLRYTADPLTHNNALHRNFELKRDYRCYQEGLIVIAIAYCQTVSIRSEHEKGAAA